MKTSSHCHSIMHKTLATPENTGVKVTCRCGVAGSVARTVVRVLYESVGRLLGVRIEGEGVRV